MIKKTIDSLLRYRHFWRDVDFTELSEIYISMLFRSLSISVVSIFIPIYMLKIGYSPIDVMALVFWYFVARFVFADIFAGWMTCKIGPKHTIIASYGLLTASTLMFLTLSSMHWPLWLLGGIYGASTSLFVIPFHVDFAKIQHKDHGGKELAYVNMLTKVGAIFGPIMSGIVGGMFGGQYIFVVAIILLLIGAWPLLRTAEPIALGGPLGLDKLKLSGMKRDIFSFMAVGVEHTASLYLWPLFLGVFVITGGAAYEKLGALASVSVIVSLATAYTIGRLADDHKGRLLLRVGTILNAAMHMVRPLATTYPAAFAVNAANDGITTSYNLPYVKGMYDAGESKENLAIAYFTCMEWLASYSRTMFWVVIIGLAHFMTNKDVMSLGFAIAAVASMLIMFEKFPALNNRRNAK